MQFCAPGDRRIGSPTSAQSLSETKNDASEKLCFLDGRHRLVREPAYTTKLNRGSRQTRVLFLSSGNTKHTTKDLFVRLLKAERKCSGFVCAGSCEREW